MSKEIKQHKCLRPYCMCSWSMGNGEFKKICLIENPDKNHLKHINVSGSLKKEEL